MSAEEPVKEKAKSTETGAGTRVSWSLQEDRILLATLMEQKKTGSQADNGWKKPVWLECEKDLAAKGFRDKTAKKCQGHFTLVRRNCPNISCNTDIPQAEEQLQVMSEGKIILQLWMG